MDDTLGEEAVTALRTELVTAVHTLTAAGAREEALAVYVPRRRKLGVPLEAVLRPVGRVWRLGALLLDAGAGLHATGQLIRATPPGRTQYVSVSAETRRAFRAAAGRGHLRDGRLRSAGAQRASRWTRTPTWPSGSPWRRTHPQAPDPCPFLPPRVCRCGCRLGVRFRRGSRGRAGSRRVWRG
ncbi:hypothetical protein [Leifsonia xyli]|uniref:hypothetical protein n=1 Tax=Leifsonia xyli TaxID=1575 RepID=UPI000AEFFC2F|nr:hypothetical protein [Leifsonia xyli]